MAPIEIFTDSGAWIAIAISRDAHHVAAIGCYRRLLHEPRTLITTNLVVAEAYEAIRRIGGHPPAMRFVEILHESSRLTKIYATWQLERQAEQILQNHADQAFSYVDAVSFATMRDRGVTEAFAFDHHFVTAGFTLVSAS